jgi:hypothetical protein
MGFLARWLSHSIDIALALFFAILAMQAPAFTREYAATLLQVAQDSQRDIDQRKDSARQFYGITAGSDEQFVAALKAFEPSNAETLALSLERSQALRGAYNRITAASPWLRPLTALRDALDDPHHYKAAIWQTLLSTYAVQVDFSIAAAVYGLGGLALGSLTAQVLFTLCRALIGGRRRARLPSRSERGMAPPRPPV